MLKAVYFLVIFSVIWLAGCAVAPGPDHETSATGKAAAAALAQEALPEGEFSPQVLYQLLIAEVAGQRGEIGVAVANYLAAARESGDPQVAERAARIAVFAQAFDAGLEAAELWVKLAPNDPEAQQMVAPLLLTFGRAPESLAHYERFIALSADKPDQGLMKIASQLVRQKKCHRRRFRDG